MIVNYYGYTRYVVLLFLLSGCYAIFLDARVYRMAGMHREKKGAQAIGWFNIAMAGALLIGNWIYRKWFW